VSPRPHLAAAVLLLALPVASEAQWGAAAGVRSVSGHGGADGGGDRSGVELRGQFDRTVSPRLTLRGEVAYTQMHTPAEDAAGRYTINENGFELGLTAHRPFAVALAQGYLLAGPVASFRAACGVDSHVDPNGRVPCAGEAKAGLGLSGGVGVRELGGDDLEWAAELRVMRGTVAAAGGTLVSISVGVRRR
jgi:hypothetical protein